MRTAAALLTLVASSAAMAAAADPQLLNMVMPDAQVVAGVNVEQAKTTPFGQWVLGQAQPTDRHMQEMVTLINFDPRRVVRELLVASPGGSDPKAGIALARGNFDLAKISAAARLGGGSVETYRSATVITDPKKQASFAFVDATTVAAGTPEQVRAALDRRGRTNVAITPALAARINQLSTTQDAWAITLVPPSGLTPPAAAKDLSKQEIFQKIAQASGGVKFGSNIVLTADAVANTPQDATALAGVLQFLANMAAANSQGDPTAAALVKALTVTAQGQNIKIGLSLPHAQFEQLVQPRARVARKKTAVQ
jgi:hypothetical protein